MLWRTTRSLVRDLEARLDKLERAHRDLDSEWTDTYEKLRNLHRRLSKRDKALESSQTPEPIGGDAPDYAPRNPLAFRLSRMAQGAPTNGLLPNR